MALGRPAPVLPNHFIYHPVATFIREDGTPNESILTIIIRRKLLAESTWAPAEVKLVITSHGSTSEISFDQGSTKELIHELQNGVTNINQIVPPRQD